MKGFVFSLNFILLAALLVAAAALSHGRLERAAPYAQMALLERLELAADDVGEDLFGLVDLNVTTEGLDLTLEDRLPAARNVSASLEHYARFVQRTYAPPAMAADFLNPQGQAIELEQLSPPLQITPYGFNYSYPTGGSGEDWGKRELRINVNPANFSQLASLNLTLNVTNATFAQNFSLSCTEGQDWDAYKACKASTEYCLNATLVVIDQAGTRYESPCRDFDLKFQNRIRIDMSGTRWLEVRFGKLETGEQLTGLRFQGLDIGTQTTFTFNQTPFSLNTLAQLRLRDVATNASLSKTV